MKTEIVRSNNGQDYLKVDLVQINQKDRSFYLTKIKASDFLKIYTVRPAQYDLEKHTSLASSFPDEKDYFNHLLNEDKANLKHKDFQRDPSDDRISKIVKFLRDEEYAFFPNTIIANCELINDWKEYALNEESSEGDFLGLDQRPEFISFLKKTEHNYTLYIPYKANSVLVIDGQHRLIGIKESPEEIQNNFDLVISFIVGYDRSVIAKQFYTINYEQKPVNKSLLYQLTGEFTREINELSFMHNVVKLLNELQESPFYGRVKMLGKTPRNYSAEQRRKLSISQAFLIDSMIRYISVKAQGTLYPPIFLKYYRNADDHIHIIRIIARYFNAVRTLKPDWETPENSVLSKGMGVTALLKVLNFLFPKILIDELNGQWAEVDRIQMNDYVRYLEGLENVDFSTGGPYGKTGSAGNVNKIKNDILTKLTYLNNPMDIQEFERDFKTSYLTPFNAKLDEISA